MIWIVSILLASLLLGGLVRLISFFRGRTDLLPKAERSIGRQRLIALAILNISFSGFGFFLLFTKTYEPLDILVGVSLVGLLFEVAFRKGSINWAG
jgi:hypothetical protein